MSIIRWEPFDEMMTLRESMDRLFEDFFTGRPRTSGPLVWQPAFEVYETDHEVVAKAEQEEKGRNYYRRELRYGSFQRTIALPNEVKSDETKTNFKQGILEVRIPKAERFGRRA